MPWSGSLGVVRVDGVEEILQLFLVEDAICKEELEFLQGQLPVICNAQGGEAAGVCGAEASQVRAARPPSFCSSPAHQLQPATLHPACCSQVTWSTAERSLLRQRTHNSTD